MKARTFFRLTTVLTGLFLSLSVRAQMQALNADGVTSYYKPEAKEPSASTAAPVYESPNVYQFYFTGRLDMFQLPIANSVMHLGPGTGEWNYGGGVGITFVYYLPFRDNMWSVIIDPALRFGHRVQTYKRKTGTEPDIYKFDFKLLSVDVPVGIRFHFYRTSSFNAYAEAALAPNIKIGNTFKYYKNDDLRFIIHPSSGMFYILGAGINAGKFNAGVRYYKNKRMLSDYKSYDAPYSGFSLVLGYRFLEKERFR